MDNEAVRLREPEPGEGAFYERQMEAINAFVERQLTARVLVEGARAPTLQDRQGLTTWYLSPHLFADTVLQEWYVFVNNVRVHSGKHIHQGGLTIFVLDGEGYTIEDGERLDWRAGDLILLPIKPGGVEHQHFHTGESGHCRWLAYVYLPQWQHVASGMKQVENNPDYRGPVFQPGTDPGDVYNPNRDFTGWAKDSFGETLARGEGFNGYAELIGMRDRERERVAAGTFVVRGDDLPWETNPQGVMQWYMHPSLSEPVTRSFLFSRQVIKPGSRSGRQLHQGGALIFFLEGRGHSVMDGVRHDWTAGDLLQLPLKPDGVAFQHFNDDDLEPTYLIHCEPNTVDALGVDRGSGFVQLENCPEYRG